ncbi:Asp23/Gls24 family envelope stress response protein [Streptomyces sp. WAC01526]|uniref:Asp23/Gls24 family envelope stress response protein n=1 Tax=Streptomyces sp. WAC01526 TaxID=2588709 RepID=UPI0011DF5404|nr:Asp23/Gls24 family envelope stress response protein [Streptomyces sp. WAC01526]
MTNAIFRPASEGRRPTDESTAQQGPKHGTVSPESRGRTTIADTVAAKIAGMAAREVPGIHNLGSGMARAIGGVRERMPGGQPSVTRGVSVEVGERQAAVDLDVVVDYGYPITEVAAEVRTSVIAAMERMTGLEVVEVNIAVNDVDIPGDEDDDSEQRVE